MASTQPARSRHATVRRVARDKLIALRKAQGWTQEEAAAETGLDRTSISRFERGEQTPGIKSCRSMASAYGVALDKVLAALDSDGQEPVPTGQAVPESLSLFVALEQAASRMWSWEPVTVHGLLQTPEYAAAVESAAELAEQELNERVRIRMARQGVLTRPPEPLHLSVVLDESVLYRVTGGPQVMRAQLTYLVEAAERPNIDVQILPLDAGIHLAGWGTFTVLAKAGSVPHLLCTSDDTGVSYNESPHAIDTHLRLFERLSASALTSEASADLMRTIVKERYL